MSGPGSEIPLADDYERVPVFVDNERWRAKVEIGHPELRGRLADVALAIRAPDLVLQDRDFRRRKHYIRAEASGNLLTAVVEYTLTRHGVAGSLVTAFIRRRLRKGDQIVFRRA